jgi:hypothetical protein
MVVWPRRVALAAVRAPQLGIRVDHPDELMVTTTTIAVYPKAAFSTARRSSSAMLQISSRRRSIRSRSPTV